MSVNVSETNEKASSQSPLQDITTTKSRLQCPFDSGLRYGSLASSQNGGLADEHSPGSSPTGRDTIGDIPAYIVDTLPTFVHQRVKNEKSYSQEVSQINNSDNLDKFLRIDLNFDRLNAIHSWLWACGRPMNARALHKQILMGRRVVITEQADLHLLTHSDVVMLKPLPSYLLCHEVWESYLCRDEKLHASACGMLLSYIWLVRSSNDYKLAKEEHRRLLPTALTFAQWRRIAMESLSYIDPDTLHQVNKRFQFGELRLGRINKVYRLTPRFFFTHFIRGYLYGYNRYGPFLHRNVSWILGVSVLLSLALSAMQVGTGVKQLSDNDAFNQASYGFVVFVCALVAAVLAFVIVVFACVYIYNMFAAISHSGSEQERRRKLAKRKREARLEP